MAALLPRFVLALIRLGALLGACMVLLAAHGLKYALARPRWKARTGFYAFVCRLFGLNARVRGTPAQGGGLPVLYLSNHLSYLDVMILGALLPARFVAKSDVAGWPLIGFLCRLQDTVFIKRTRAALQEGANVAGRLMSGGDSLVIFPEGTSSDGSGVKPFKAGLMEAFYGAGARALVQPVAIVLEKVEDRPVAGRQDLRDIYAWWRPETTLIPHLWGVACTRRFDVSVHFLEPVDPGVFPGRKELTRAVFESVRAIVEPNAALGYKAPEQDVPVAQLDRATVS